MEFIQCSFDFSFFKKIFLGIFADLQGGGQVWESNTFAVRDLVADGANLSGIEFSTCLTPTTLQTTDFILEDTILRSTSKTVGISSTQSCSGRTESWDSITFTLENVNTQQSNTPGWWFRGLR